MIFVAALLFVLAALKAATWLSVGPGFWFWGFLGFAAWVLTGVLGTPVFWHRRD